MSRRGQKTDKTGRTRSGDKFARLFLKTLQCPAWRALSPYAQCLYPWMLLEWDGPRSNNNGQIGLSVRQAAPALACNTETARRAFLDLQAKGFLVVTRCAALGIAGKARGHKYEITELGTAAEPVPRKLFRDWKPGCDFPVVKAAANNPRGIGGAQNLEFQLTDRDANGPSQLTDRDAPNLQNRTNGTKNGDFPTHSVRHPYLPEGAGEAEPLAPASTTAKRNRARAAQT